MGLSSETTRSWMSCGNGWRHRIGGWPGQNRTPPIPALAASTAWRTVGSSGTSSAMRVGRRQRSCARRSKSSIWARMWRLMRTLPSPASLRPSWRAPNSPALPGIPTDIKRSSPSTFCHFLTLIRFFPRSMSKMSWRRCFLWSGSSRVPRMVSMIQPRMSFRVAHEPSPLRSFLTEAASLRRSSPSRGLSSTMSIAWRMLRRRFLIWRRLP